MPRDYNLFRDWLIGRLAEYSGKDYSRGSAEGLSRLLGVSRATVYTWISSKDKCRPRTELARKIAEVYDVNYDFIRSLYVSRKPGPHVGSKDRPRNIYISEYFNR